MSDKKLSDCKTDQERWEWVFAHPDDVFVQLDNDVTYVSSGEDEVKLDHYLGNGLGVINLLSILGIDSDYV